LDWQQWQIENKKSKKTGQSPIVRKVIPKRRAEKRAERYGGLISHANSEKKKTANYNQITNYCWKYLPSERV
jgi:hypothetical protein